MTATFAMRNLFNQIEDLPDPDLITRELGLQAYSLLHQALTETPSGETLVLDFTGTRVMDSSFAGGSLLKLLRELVAGAFGERYLFLTNATPSTEENIDMTILGHGLKLALLSADSAGNRRILGRLEPNLKETLTLINQQGTLTARELADLNVGMAINTASNRLKKLYNLHLIHRMEEITETGRQHVYHALG